MEPSSDPRDRVLRRIDEAMALLEEAERALGRLARSTGRGGGVYHAYTSLVRLRDKIAEIREEVYRLPCEVREKHCWGSQ